MNTLRTTTTVISSLLLISFALTGCSASAVSSTTSNDKTSVAKTEAPAPAPDLAGSWKQTNSHSKDAYQAAVIKGGTIEVNWVSDGGDTTSLYWAGSYEAPTKAGAFSRNSKNDKSKTSKAMLASPDESKTFTYSNGQISYKVSLAGTTMTVRLAKR